jgi:hypothetical protein
MSVHVENPSHLAHSESASHDESSDPALHAIGRTIRTLSISNHNWKGNVRIVDASNTTPLYTVNWTIRKPLHLTISWPDHDNNLGSITFHALTTRIDTMVHGHSIAIRPKGFLCKKLSYASPSFDNTTLTWQYQGHFKTFDLTCLTEDSLPVARISINVWGVKKMGTIEIYNESASSGPAMDEIVVTAFAVAEYWSILNTSSAGVAPAFVR